MKPGNGSIPWITFWPKVARSAPAGCCNSYRCTPDALPESTSLSLPPPPTKTPSLPSSSHPFPAARKWNAASRAWCVGTRWPWWCEPTSSRKASADIFRLTLRPRPCMKSLSTISCMRGPRTVIAIWSIFKDTLPPEFMPARILEGRIPKQKLENFRRELKAGRRTLFLSTSLAHARFLGVPHGFHGSRTHPGDLSGALHALSRKPRT